MSILEETYVFFKILPYSKNVKGGLLKAPKYYFYDLPRVLDAGARFENLVALSLYKELLYQKDVEGEDFSLHFVRNKQKQEIDFIISKNREPLALIEARSSDDSPSTAFLSFEEQLSPKRRLTKIQIVKNLKRDFTSKHGIEVVNAATWLAKLDFSKSNLQRD
jgi:predicted AAA+ superfamily ATPase